MMTLLVFDVLLFGLFSVLLGQFIGQSREAYAIWIKEFVYPDAVAKSTAKCRNLIAHHSYIKTDDRKLLPLYYKLILKQIQEQYKKPE